MRHWITSCPSSCLALAALAGLLGVLIARSAAASSATLEDAALFIETAQARLHKLAVEADRAAWVQATYITDDTEMLAASANERRMAAAAELARDATRFDKADLPSELARQLRLLKLAQTIPAPAEATAREELTRILARMEGAYGKGKWRRKDEQGQAAGLGLDEMSRILRASRDPREMLDLWRGWRTVSPPYRRDYARHVELSNAGARELGFADVGVLWRAKYDMPPDEFSRDVERLWDQVRPLYVSLHAYIRRKLREAYGPDIVPENGPIPAHLLGNMWAQDWSHLYPLVAPRDKASSRDLTALLKAKGVDEREMVRLAERFFVSLGLDPLPRTFWERSLFVKPRDREVVCHASAWDVDAADDLRIKMCIEITGEDFTTIHHELGHNYYQRAYRKLPFLFRDSANDGFHEAIGDTIALSVTPRYLAEIGLGDDTTRSEQEVGQLLRMALEKVAFLPFGLLVDQWRFKVFSGEIPPDRYNQAWWELREKYQGVAAPVSRSEADFDPGAKYHVAAGVPYTRYFLAHILQFQFHRALCAAAGQTGPLHRCSIYGSREAGTRLSRMMELGQSRPWPDALEVLTGERRMDATAILDYFAPLQAWLDEQNQGVATGWRRNALAPEE
ncbi:MAG: M2 family metallopeptidase [Vicinamibacteria bacterium]|nr:M2 family metallopeptidase [Vicinamibacteria bacterium]